MLDICFGESECGMLKVALRTKNIVMAYNSLELGKIAVSDFETVRKEWNDHVFSFCSKRQRKKILAEQTKQFKHILDAAKRGKDLRIWHASAPYSRAAYAWSVETSIYVRESERKSGIGKALYASLEKALAAQNMTNLNACIASPVVDDKYLNHNSIQFHQHLGYSMVGEFHKCAYKFGRWYNMVWMEKIIADHPDRQPDVIPFAQIPPEIYC